MSQHFVTRNIQVHFHDVLFELKGNNYDQKEMETSTLTLYGNVCVAL